VAAVTCGMHRDDVLASGWQRSCRTWEDAAPCPDAPPGTEIETEIATEIETVWHSPWYRRVVGLAIAWFVIALGAELVHLRGHHDGAYAVALVANVGGLCLALGAAVLATSLRALGCTTLPRTEETRNLALQQLLFHALALLLFGARTAHLYRGWTERSMVPLDTHVAIAYGLLGLVTIAIAASLGWALAHSPADDPRLLRPRVLRRRSRQLAFEMQLRSAAAGFP
jgi:hypothetical protein